MEEETSNKKFNVFEGHPPEVRTRTKKMVIYLFIFAVVMLFGGFTSGYIVKMAGEYWMHVNPPQVMLVSMVFLVLSSLTMWLSLRMMKSGKKSLSAWMMILTFAMGIGFTVTQYKGWGELSEKGMGFTMNYDENGIKRYQLNHYQDITAPYGEDYYFHLNGQKIIKDGDDFYLESDTVFANPLTKSIINYSNNASAFLVVLIVVHLLHLFLGLIYIIVNFIRIQMNIITPEDSIRLRVNGIYWHFMGILWIYLFVFLFIIH